MRINNAHFHQIKTWIITAQYGITVILLVKSDNYKRPPRFLDQLPVHTHMLDLIRCPTNGTQWFKSELNRGDKDVSCKPPVPINITKSLICLGLGLGQDVAAVIYWLTLPGRGVSSMLLSNEGMLYNAHCGVV